MAERTWPLQPASGMPRNGFGGPGPVSAATCSGTQRGLVTPRRDQARVRARLSNRRIRARRSKTTDSPRRDGLLLRARGSAMAGAVPAGLAIDADVPPGERPSFAAAAAQRDHRQDGTPRCPSSANQRVGHRGPPTAGTARQKPSHELDIDLHLRGEGGVQNSFRCDSSSQLGPAAQPLDAPRRVLLPTRPLRKSSTRSADTYRSDASYRRNRCKLV